MREVTACVEQEQAYYETGENVAEGSKKATLIEQMDGVGTEGGEGGEGSTHADSEEEQQTSRHSSVQLAPCGEETEQKASDDVDHKGAERQRQERYVSAQATHSVA